MDDLRSLTDPPSDFVRRGLEDPERAILKAITRPPNEGFEPTEEEARQVLAAYRRQLEAKKLTAPTTEDLREPDHPAAFALARHIADHPVSTIQAAFRYLGMSLEFDLQDDKGELAAAIASCPGRELDPNPCKCPCYGCKHHCSAHNPSNIDPDR